MKDDTLDQGLSQTPGPPIPGNEISNTIHLLFLRDPVSPSNIPLILYSVTSITCFNFSRFTVTSYDTSHLIDSGLFIWSRCTRYIPGSEIGRPNLSVTFSTYFIDESKEERKGFVIQHNLDAPLKNFPQLLFPFLHFYNLHYQDVKFK